MSSFPPRVWRSTGVPLVTSLVLATSGCGATAGEDAGGEEGTGDTNASGSATTSSADTGSTSAAETSSTADTGTDSTTEETGTTGTTEDFSGAWNLTRWVYTDSEEGFDIPMPMANGSYTPQGCYIAYFQTLTVDPGATALLSNNAYIYLGTCGPQQYGPYTYEDALEWELSTEGVLDLFDGSIPERPLQYSCTLSGASLECQDAVGTNQLTFDRPVCADDMGCGTGQLCVGQQCVTPESGGGP